MSFHVGQKVVCINDKPREPNTRWFGGEAPVVGQTYTIKRVYVFNGCPSVWLEEVARHQRSLAIHGTDVGYGAYRFRPVIERKTSIDIFTAMLTPSPTKREHVA